MNRDALWNKCVGTFDPSQNTEKLVKITWEDVNYIKGLINCNPFSIDRKGLFLRNVVLTGCVTEKHGKFIKLQLLYDDPMYQDVIVKCLDEHMFR